MMNLNLVNYFIDGMKSSIDIFKGKRYYKMKVDVKFKYDGVVYESVKEFKQVISDQKDYYSIRQRGLEAIIIALIHELCELEIARGVSSTDSTATVEKNIIKSMEETLIIGGK